MWVQLSECKIADRADPKVGRMPRLKRDLTRREIAILVPIALLCVFIGVYPKSLQSSINPTITANVFHQSTDSFAAAGVQPDMLADADTGEMHP